VNLVIICTPGNTGSSLLTAAFTAHGFAGVGKGHRSSKYATHENKTINTISKRYIKENGGSPWAIGGNFTVSNDWPKRFKDALRGEGLSNENNVVIKGFSFLWLKDKMPPAYWIFARRNQQRTVESMLERLSQNYSVGKDTVEGLVGDYFTAAEDLCDYVVDMDAFVAGDAQCVPEIMSKCDIVYDRARMASVIRKDLWRGGK